MSRKIATIVGARPQFVKAAAMARALEAAGLAETVIHTGQHFDDGLSGVFFRELEIRQPAHNLGIHGGSHVQMTARMMSALEEVLEKEEPDLVVVHGDTNSTLAGALASAQCGIPVAHVEAGLRSFNRRMPEELNRVTADHLSTLLFCPTSTAVENLRREGVERNVYLVGDVMFDSALHARALAAKKSLVLERLGLAAGDYAVATVHRAENTDDPELLAEIVRYLAEESEGRELIFPIHPRTDEALARYGLGLGGSIRTCPPLSYLDMVQLVAHAAEVFTDSGGLQKEAYFFGVPCVTLRDETEWVETVDAGWNRLWRGPDYLPRRPIEEYGAGKAAAHIARVLQEFAAARLPAR